MTARPRPRTYHCWEYEPVDISVADLLGANGELRLFPEVASGRFFDIVYSNGRLTLRTKGIVGLIPISENVLLHVRPRAPVGNLLYMTWRARMGPLTIPEFVRAYQLSTATAEDPADLYLQIFLRALEGVERVGLLRRYQERQTDSEVRGRLLVNPTVTRYRSKSLRGRNVFSVFERTVDNPENRFLKFVIQRLVRHTASRDDRESRLSQARLRKFLGMFQLVNATTVGPREIAGLTKSLIRGLPRSHHSYEPALWLCHLMATRSGVVLERMGSSRFETLVIDVGVVFENYVRRICEEFATEHLGKCRVRNGNTRSIPLFVDNPRYPASPDYYFECGGVFKAVADAKYKPRISAADRYEMLGFCEALEVDVAAFVCPRSSGVHETELHGTTARGTRLYVVPIDLGAADLPLEERRFVAELGSVLGLSTRAVA